MTMIQKLEKYKSAEPILYNVALVDKVPPGARFGPIVRDTYIVECNVSGYGSVVVNNTEFPVGPGDCYILLPGNRVIHTADKKDPRRGMYCAMGGMRVGQLLAEAGITPESPFAPPEMFSELCSVLEKMLSLKGDTDRGAELRRISCIYELLGVLNKKSQTADKELWVKKALGIFETEYHTQLSVADVAEEVGFDRSYFSTIFKERVGVSPHKYLTSLRVGKAAVLLSEGEHSVSQIAESVGLDPVNFSRLFKKEMGVSPIEYRKKDKKPSGSPREK